MMKKMISGLYCFVLVMMIAVAFLAAAQVILPGGAVLAAVLLGASAAVLIADISVPSAC